MSDEVKEFFEKFKAGAEKMKKQAPDTVAGFSGLFNPHISPSFGFERLFCPASAFSALFSLDVSLRYAFGQKEPAALKPVKISRSKQSVIIKQSGNCI